jgi:protein arginine N-methyltransferase 1
MYSLHDYTRMIADEARTGSYVRALQAVVRPGAVVADIGTGTGLFALTACRLGARRVYAIDTNEAVQIGRELARENGFSDRVVFFQNDSRAVELPERVGVIVSDLRGVLPLWGDHLAILADARERFLAPGGILVPCRDHLMVAVVERQDLHEWALGPSDGPLGIRLDAMRARLSHAPRPDRATDPLTPSHLMTAAAAWATLEYATVTPVPIAGHVELPTERPGMGHGLAIWFEAVLAPEIGFSTGPGHELCYGRLFLPWPRPVALSKGDVVTIDIWAQPGGDPWGWNTSVRDAASRRMIEAFKQSNFLSWPAKPASGGRREAIAKDPEPGHSVGPT